MDNGYTRLCWAVLNWNTDAIALYETAGAQPQNEWTTYRLSGPELAELAWTPLIRAGDDTEQKERCGGTFRLRGEERRL